MVFRVLLLSAALTTLPFTGRAAPHNAVPELVAESAGFAPGRPVTLALRFVMAPGWHIYWKNPGDSGTPPSVKWKLPAGVKAGPFAWPTPKKIDMPPLSNLGYEGEASLLAELAVPASYEGARL
ncbi:MAG TPA: protein-disulfide reductase DsbD family protein, partial [Elusimicrobiales bacterium]|nr:protein-disulfide reductase DsbD family protein [Elusimicrobiales bacterium]